MSVAAASSAFRNGIGIDRETDSDASTDPAGHPEFDKTAIGNDVNRQNFPTIALLVSVALLALVTFGGPSPDGSIRLPLLMVLLACELGAIINVIAVYVGLPALRQRPPPWRALLRLTANLLLVAAFALHLFAFWPG